jgi:hypothetical protein
MAKLPLSSTLLILVVFASKSGRAQNTIRGWTTSDTVSMSLTNKHTGSSSACLRLSGAGNDRAVLEQPIKADHYRGKKVQLSAFVLIQDWIPGYLTIGINVARKNAEPNSCWIHPVETTRGQWVKQPWAPNPTGWGQCDIPADAVGMTVYLDLRAGPNRNPPLICIDDVSIDIIGNAGPTDPARALATIDPVAEKRKVDAYANASLELVNPSFEK